jgi:pseudaminic acid cytidylyltransferase
MIKIKRLLVIPARKGSKRIKNKNFKNFFKKPIIEYSVKNAINSNIFNIIHISTNDKKIENFIKKKYKKIQTDPPRPNYLCNDHAKLVDVIKFSLDHFEKKNKIDEIWMLMPCSPLINFKDLINASEILRKKKALTTVVEEKISAYWSYKLKKKILIPIFPNYIEKKSQDLKKTYKDVGLFAGWKIKYFKDILKKRKIFKFTPYIIKTFKGIDIDNKEDWQNAEQIYKNKLHKF